MSEAPRVLQQLIPLDATQLGKLAELLGFPLHELRRSNGMPVGRITPDLIVHLLAGEGSAGHRSKLADPKKAARLMSSLDQRTLRLSRARDAAQARIDKLENRLGAAAGAGDKYPSRVERQLSLERRRLSSLNEELDELRVRSQRLTGIRDRVARRGFTPVPTTPKEALRQACALEAASSGEQREDLLGLYNELLQVKRPHGVQEYGAMVEGALQAGIKGLVGVGPGLGLNLSPADRVTGKRTVTPHAELGMLAAVASASYTAKPGESGKGGAINLPFINFGFKPTWGRYFSIQVPLVGAIILGERLVGLSAFRKNPLKVWKEDWGKRKVQGNAGLTLGISGDPVQNVTGPIFHLGEHVGRKAKRSIERTQAYDSFLRLGAKVRSLRRSPSHEASSSSADLRGNRAAAQPSEDWLATTP
ncbi:MAG TPA: hypothetical protein VEY30_10875 [Myxococcaceae bacterium]|nr:hypothetical protein [Myxococcaceae bacterium]